MKLEVSIPRKLHDEWEPTIKVKIKNYECFSLCDLGASVSKILKSLCDVLGLTDIEECSLNLHLADSTIKKPLVRINDVLILANRNYAHRFHSWYWLQSVINSPHAYEQNKAFTKHIVDAMMKALENNN